MAKQEIERCKKVFQSSRQRINLRGWMTELKNGEERRVKTVQWRAKKTPDRRFDSEVYVL
jgi:hypothetical protein